MSRGVSKEYQKVHKLLVDLYEGIGELIRTKEMEMVLDELCTCDHTLRKREASLERYQAQPLPNGIVPLELAMGMKGTVMRIELDPWEGLKVMWSNDR
jgi:hypothetical protein